MNNRIKELRKNLGLNQTDFGEGINLSKSQIACYENGSRNITDRSINDICEKYRVNEDWLKFGTGEMYKPEPELDELAYLMGMFVANNDESTTRAKIIKAMLSLDDDGEEGISLVLNNDNILSTIEDYEANILNLFLKYGEDGRINLKNLENYIISYFKN